ncbi:hypothetical protein [Streptomyces cellulosae]|uniref:hypothetical protein n=1 Tax=Streptomyces cellulosae TaxID=1968 RepID=UPI00131E77B0|nr:hypothetical protein [Streptomyces cellulosae]
MWQPYSAYARPYLQCERRTSRWAETVDLLWPTWPEATTGPPRPATPGSCCVRNPACDAGSASPAAAHLPGCWRGRGALVGELLAHPRKNTFGDGKFVPLGPHLRQYWAFHCVPVTGTTDRPGRLWLVG